VIAMIGPDAGARRWGGANAEAVLLVRRNATGQGIEDAMTALATPHALVLGRPASLSPELAALTPREHEVLTELALGKVNKEIARDLHLTRQTAQRYVGRVLNKLGVSNRTEAARVALLGRQPSRPRLVEGGAG
jgi:DNA-binding NarL/FixJ family response regulator